jgi:hypothetical protein
MSSTGPRAKPIESYTTKATRQKLPDQRRENKFEEKTAESKSVLAAMEGKTSDCSLC